jgi:ubiquinone/menaquinone biosynthesis C-methylase UbiE
MINNNANMPGGKELIDARSLLEKMGIGEKMVVADLGCGKRAYFSLQAAKLVGSFGLVYAVDVLKTALKNVISMANLFGVANIKTVWADLEVFGATKILDQTIDLVIINNVLFQASKSEIILQEAGRILKKGGKLLVTDWKKTLIPFGPSAENRIDPEKIKNQAQGVGLILIDEFEAGPYHFGLIFEKR